MAETTPKLTPAQRLTLHPYGPADDACHGRCGDLREWFAFETRGLMHDEEAHEVLDMVLNRLDHDAEQADGIGTAHVLADLVHEAIKEGLDQDCQDTGEGAMCQHIGDWLYDAGVRADKVEPKPDGPSARLASSSPETGQ